MDKLLKMLGYKARDVVTGFEGVITSVSVDLYGCKTVLLNPGIGEDGKLGEQSWFDSNRLTITSSKRVMEPPFLAEDKGAESKPAQKV